MSLVNLTNYRDHPSNPSYVVFFFHRKEVADSFEELLLINMIDFERAHDDAGHDRHLFGIRKMEFQAAERLNYQAIGKHRKGFIPNRFLRIFVLLFTLAVLIIAIIGAYLAGL